VIRAVWATDWAWSVPLTALTLAFHSAAVVGIAVPLIRVGRRVGQRPRGRAAAAVLAMSMIGAVGCALAVLHGLDALIWAIAYLLLDAFDTLGEAMLYSVDSLATRGASGLELPNRWRMMGALQAANGVLLFGISTAFLFSVLSEAWKSVSRVAHQEQPRHDNETQGKPER
jgi:hypothetical protein